MKKIFFLSDPHYHHKNLVRGCSSWENKDVCRNYDTLKEHDDDVARINKVVSKDDILYLGGDIAFGGIEFIHEFRERINCLEVYTVLGNHDHHLKKDRNGIRHKLFAGVADRMAIDIPDGRKIILDHYPLEDWEGARKGWIHLYGHTHNRTFGPGKRMCISMDSNGEMHNAYSLEFILENVDPFPIQNHH